jgi:MFS family permease
MDIKQGTNRLPFSMTNRDFSILLSNLLDHFDSALYGFLAPILGPIFFPGYDPIVQIIFAYSVMATSIITRPLGALIFGNIARQYGPLVSMSYSITGVAIFGIAIGFIPSHEQIGFWSAGLLLIIRFIKGIFAAGEHAVVKLYILENKDYKSAFKVSYIYQGSSMLGTILASGVSALILWMERPDLWRFCFMGSGLGCFIAYGIRYFDTTQAEKKLFQSYEISMFKSLWKYKISILSVAFTTALSHMTYAIPCIVMNSLMPLIADITFIEMIELNTILLIFDMIMIFTIGPFLARFNYLDVIRKSTIAIILSIPLLMIFLPGSNLWYISFVRIWIVFLGVIFMCPQNLYYKKLFENTNEQYVLVGISNALGAGVIGKTMPVVSMWLWYMTESVWSIAGYIGLIGVSVYLLILAS